METIDKSLSLWERLSREANGSQKELVDKPKLLTRWIDQVADGNLMRFRRRLALGQYTFEQASCACSEECLSARDSFECECLPTFGNSDVVFGSLTDTDISDISVPFNGVLLDITHPIRNRAREILGTPSLQESFERELIKKVSGISTKLLTFAFNKFIFQDERVRLSQFTSEGSKQRTLRKSHDFRMWMQSEGLRSLSHDFPVWRRLVYALSNSWLENLSILVFRLANDRQRLKSQLGIADTSAWKSVEFAGDSHRGGRHVSIIRFDNGASVVYKPRDVVIDDWYADTITWLNGNAPIDFKAVKVVQCEGYGWSEFVPYRPCASHAELKSFYHRIGGLLGLWYLLGGSDCHYENVIACGDNPVLIDPETIFDSNYRFLKGMSRSVPIGALCTKKLLDSVLKVGLLPNYQKPNKDVEAFDISGIGMRSEIAAPFNTQDPTVSFVSDIGEPGNRRTLQAQKNVPFRLDQPLGYECREAVCKGLETILEFVENSRTAFIQQVRRVNKVPGARVRLVSRPTHLYARIIDQSVSPECLEDGRIRSIEIDRLSRVFTGKARSSWARQMLCSEISSVEQCDVPLFDVPVHAKRRGRVLCSELGILNRTPGKDPLTSALNRIHNLSKIGRKFQVRLAREVLAVDDVERKHVGRQGEPPSLNSTLVHPDQWNSEIVWQRIKDIASRLQSTAFEAKDGGVSWIALCQSGSATRYEHQWVGNSLYQGNAGIAIFFAALYQVTAEEQYRTMTWRILTPVLQELKLANTTRTPFFSRLVALFYPLTVIAKLLEDQGLVGSLERFLRVRKKRDLMPVNAFDVIGGSAGGILALLAFHRRFRSDSALNCASLVGEYLVKSRSRSSNGFNVWQIEDRPLLGFAHGCTGIALAVARLSAECERGNWSKVVDEVVAYERSMFSSSEQNWPDLRSSLDSTARFNSMAWCHGGTGIGLAYLSISSCLPTIELGNDIRTACLRTKDSGMPVIDTVCCGLFSHLALLDAAAKRDIYPENSDYVRRCIMSYLVRSPKWESVVPHLREDVCIPGFFNGSAGIGYELLRVGLGFRQLPSIIQYE